MEGCRTTRNWYYQALLQPHTSTGMVQGYATDVRLHFALQVRLGGSWLMRCSWSTADAQCASAVLTMSILQIKTRAPVRVLVHAVRSGRAGAGREPGGPAEAHGVPGCDTCTLAVRATWAVRRPRSRASLRGAGYVKGLIWPPAGQAGAERGPGGPAEARGRRRRGAGVLPEGQRAGQGHRGPGRQGRL